MSVEKREWKVFHKVFDNNNNDCKVVIVIIRLVLNCSLKFNIPFEAVLKNLVIFLSFLFTDFRSQQRKKKEN